MTDEEAENFYQDVISGKTQPEWPTERTVRLVKEQGARDALTSLASELEVVHDAPETVEMYRAGLRHALRKIDERLASLAQPE